MWTLLKQISLSKWNEKITILILSVEMKQFCRKQSRNVRKQSETDGVSRVSGSSGRSGRFILSAIYHCRRCFSSLGNVPIDDMQNRPLRNALKPMKKTIFRFLVFEIWLILYSKFIVNWGFKHNFFLAPILMEFFLHTFNDFNKKKIIKKLFFCTFFQYLKIFWNAFWSM